jgi:hypothetical protein
MYLGANPPPNIAGTRESVNDTDTNRVFYAGIAFGTAAAGYMVAIQTLFEWLTSKSRLNQIRLAARR